MADKVSIDKLASTIMEGLEEYKELQTENLKKAVKKAGNTVKKEIEDNAPVKSGTYKKSWAVKKTKETSNSLTVVVHSKNRYQLAHLLEKGHALRNGGRSKAIPHIKPAEEVGISQLEEDIERSLKNGWVNSNLKRD